MSKIIVTSRYLKCGSKKKLKNYVKYIATREGSVLTVSERENYVGYLANRPNSHGLFNGKDDPINLEKTANEIADHSGNVWTYVVSLRRDDAQKMGYDNLNAWRDLVLRQIPNIAKQSKIDMKNLRWYAAFHDKENNPHVHIVVYSADEREGFLSNHGIEKIRSGFANDIYYDELHHLYEQQTDLRNLLKKESEQLMKSLAEKISQDNNFDSELMDLVSKLHDQLAESKGKKVYGYLKPDVKKTVDEIFAKLADNDSVKKMYDLWCEMEQQKHDVYSFAKVKFPELQDNNEFKSVKNMIIQQILNMNFSVPEINSDRLPDVDYDLDIAPPDDDELLVESLIPTNHIENEGNNKYHIKWSDDYKDTCMKIYNKQSNEEDFQQAGNLLLKEAKLGNVIAMYELGKFYSSDKFGKQDNDKSYHYYSEALKGFTELERNPVLVKLQPYIQYQIGKMHCYGWGMDKDCEKAFEWFMKSAQTGNKFAQFSVGNLYYYGNGVEKDLKLALEWYEKSAKKGQPYAAYAAAKMYEIDESCEQDSEIAQKYYRQALLGFLKIESSGQADDRLHYKLGLMYKKGLGTEIDISKAVDFFEKSADKNMWASYQLGRFYLFGIQGVEKNKGKAVKWLNLSAEQGNEYSQNLLENMEQYEAEMLADTVLGLFANLSRIIADDYNQKFQSGRILVDRKLHRMIQDKKQALGIREEQSY